jgi:hypothetical protein
MRVSLRAHHASPARCMDALCDACCVMRCCTMRAACHMLCDVLLRDAVLRTVHADAEPARTAPHRTARPQRPLSVRRCDATQPPPPGPALGGRGRAGAAAHRRIGARGLAWPREGAPEAPLRGREARDAPCARGRSATAGAALARSNQTALRDGPGPLHSCGERTWTGYRTLARGRLYVSARAWPRRGAARCAAENGPGSQ